jgi:hypothetical protein
MSSQASRRSAHWTALPDSVDDFTGIRKENDKTASR